MDQYFTVQQVAEKLQVHWMTVLRYIKANKLRAVKLGRYYRIDPKDLEEFIESVKTAKP